jgi:hypothetical protein
MGVVTGNMTFAAQLSTDAFAGIRRVGEDGHAQSERRRSLRLPLQWCAYVSRAGATHPLRGKTKNLSSHGFYCVLNECLTLGERISCDLVVPTHISRNFDDVLLIRCQAWVLRAEPAGVGEGYGLACRIEDYCLINGAAGDAPPSALPTTVESV